MQTPKAINRRNLFGLVSWLMALVPLALGGCAAYIPTGSDSEMKVVAVRQTGEGKTTESLVEETVSSGRFYPATVEGPFVSSRGVSAYRYFLQAADGKKRRLDFLERRENYERFREFCPIPDGRWVGVSCIQGPMADYVEDAVIVNVLVFDASHLLFRQRIVGCYQNQGKPLSGSRKPPEWRPLKEGMKLYQLNYVLDPVREDAVFRTNKGDVVFNFKNGSLKPEAGR